MVTSSNGNIIRVTGHLCREFTPHKGQWRSFDVFFDLRLNKRLGKQWWRHQMETLSALLAICAGNSPHTKASDGALVFSLICAWINGWVNNGEASDLRRHHAHYDVPVMSHPKSNQDRVKVTNFKKMAKIKNLEFCKENLHTTNLLNTMCK